MTTETIPDAATAAPRILSQESAVGDLPMRGADGFRFWSREKQVTERWPEPGRREALSLVFPSNR